MALSDLYVAAGADAELVDDARVSDALACACEGLVVTPYVVRAELARDDLLDISSGALSAAALRAFSMAIQEQVERHAGRVPERYTQSDVCKHCGPVWLPSDWPQPVTSCPWCFNRMYEFPIPRPGTERSHAVGEKSEQEDK